MWPVPSTLSLFPGWGFRKKPLITLTTCTVRDILLDPPQTPADTAFFFKEAHRFEARKKGCNRAFWISLPVKTIVLTLPAENLTGTHQMRDRQRGLIEKNIEGLGWQLEETEIAGEMIFIIRK